MIFLLTYLYCIFLHLLFSFQSCSSSNHHIILTHHHHLYAGKYSILQRSNTRGNVTVRCRCRGWFITMISIHCIEAPVLVINSNLIHFTVDCHRRRRVLSSVIASVRLSIRPSCLSVRTERRSRSNSLRISAIRLTFGGMMHSTMEQIGNRNGHAQPIFAASMELWNFPW